MIRGTLRQALIVLAVVATIVVNMAAVLLPLGGRTTGELAERFDVFFLPAGYVFGIWSLIYVQLVAFAVWQALPARRNEAWLDRLAPAFLLGSLANCVWIFLWHYELVPASLVAMLVLLGSLAWTYRDLEVGRRPADASRRWLVHALFSVYLGWICVATVANVTTALVDAGWRGGPLSEEWWTAIALGVVVALMAVIGHRHRDALLLAVPVWAAIGIAARFPDVPVVTPSSYLAAAAIALLAVLALWRRREAAQPLLPV